MNDLSHFDESGRVTMVDVADKPLTQRTATASCKVMLAPETIAAVSERVTPKGDPVEIARIAGIMAAKKTSELIPLCHQINLSKADVTAQLTDYGVRLEATAKTSSQTGVEMEALTAVAVAALTIYDMCKALQKDIEITDIRLELKTGGKTDYTRATQTPEPG